MEILNQPIVYAGLAMLISWGLFALLCSSIHEIISQSKAERGKFMKKYLLQQLNDRSNGVNWASLLYMHGSVDLLSRKTNEPSSDIAPPIFAKAMIEIVGSSHIVKSGITPEVKSVIQHKQPALANFKAASLVLKQSDVNSFFKQSIEDAEIKSINDKGEINEGLLYKNLTENLEQWFIQFNNRLSEWYKKKTRIRLFLLALVIACAINIDSIQLVNFFKTQPEVSKKIISYYEKNDSTLLVLSANANFRNGSEEIEKYFKSLNDLQQESKMPIGLDKNIFSEISDSFCPCNISNSLTLVFLKIFGIIISAGAASVGAPFWFETFKKLYSNGKK